MNASRLARIALVLALLLVQVAAWAQPVGFAVNSRGFGAEEDIHVLWRVDLPTGQAERIGHTGFEDMEGLALAPDGTLYGADDQDKTLVTINTNSGFSSPVGGIRFNMGIPLAQSMDFGMAFTCSGELLVSSDTEQSLFLASLETGRLARIGEPGSLDVPITDIAAWGNKLYGIGQGLAGEDGKFTTDAPNLYRIDRDTATAELVGSLGEAVLPYANAGLSFDAQGNLWAITDRRANFTPDIPSQILEIDLETGAARKSTDAEIIGFESLAIAPPGGCQNLGGIASDPREIPANSPAGLVILAFVLLIASSWTLVVRQR